MNGNGEVVCVVAIKNEHILLVKKKFAWILPGGKIEAGESHQDCIVREINEELPGTTVVMGEKIGDFSGRTPNSGRVFTAHVYFAEIGKIKGVAREIEEMKWARRVDEMQLSEVTQKVINELRKREIFL